MDLSLSSSRQGVKCREHPFPHLGRNLSFPWDKQWVLCAGERDYMQAVLEQSAGLSWPKNVS